MVFMSHWNTKMYTCAVQCIEGNCVKVNWLLLLFNSKFTSYFIVISLNWNWKWFTLRSWNFEMTMTAVFTGWTKKLRWNFWPDFNGYRGLFQLKWWNETKANGLTSGQILENLKFVLAAHRIHVGNQSCTYCDVNVWRNAAHFV